MCFEEKATAPHSSTLAWKIPWIKEPGRLQSMGSLESDTTEQLHFHFSLSCIGEGNGNPLHYSCLENPRDGGAQWAAVYEVTQSWTQLKRLGSSSSSSRMCFEHTTVLKEIQYFGLVLITKTIQVLDIIQFSQMKLATIGYITMVGQNLMTGEQDTSIWINYYGMIKDSLMQKTLNLLSKKKNLDLDL